MIIELFIFLCGAALAITGSLTFWPVQAWYDFYIPIVLFIAGYVGGLFLIVWNVYWIAGKIISLKKNRDKPSRVARWMVMQGLRFMSIHALIKTEFRGANKLPKHEKFVLVCNHRSKFDSFLLSYFLGKYDLAFITKDDNMKIPLAKPLILSMGYLAIDRGDKLQSLEVMKTATDYVKNGYTCMGVFPEGTRQKVNSLGEFHEGVFNIALHSNAPLVVMTCWGTDRVAKNFPWKITKVRLDVLCTLMPEDIEGKPAIEISNMVHELMLEHIEMLRSKE